MSRIRSRPRRIQFLQDKPADQDFFGTHRDLANALASALVSNPELRTIGLLGKWGSGKSTVLRELERAIGLNAKLSDIQTFTFDAWEHQGEPIRRSFLESLFGFLNDNKLIEATDWQADIDLLSGRLGETENIETPDLSKPAKRILWSLPLAPIGLALFGLDTLKEGLGKTTTTAGQVAFWVSIACFAIPAIFTVQAIFAARGSKKKSSDDEVIGLIVNKKVNRVKTRTIKSPEPTAIEFANTCESLIAEVRKRRHRLLCVIDNLDRLPAQDALDMWSAIRAIFANIQIGGADRGHPFVLVPMDHSALLASFGGNEKDERAKSFIDKTFDLTFRVPPPVRSDWKAFLRSQMETVFGKGAIEDRTMYFVEKVFDAKHRTANEFPTPRVINRFVNSVAATWLARRADNFPLAIVSVFVANVETLDDSVLEFTQREDLNFFDSDFPDWRDQIVALYFGVPEKKSRQVLLEGPLRKAIDDADVGRFGSLMKYPGAFKVFDDTLRQYPYDAANADSQAFAFKVAELLQAVQGESEAVRRSRDYVLDRIAESAPAPSLNQLEEKFGPLTNNLSRRQVSKLVPAVAGWLSSIASSADDADDFSLIGRLYDRLNELKPAGGIPKIVLRGEPSAVINSVYWINGNDILESSAAVEIPFSKLTPELAKLVEDEDQAFVVPEVLAFRSRFPTAFPDESAVTLTDVQNASISMLTTSEGVSPLTRYAAENLGILASTTKESEEAIDQMIDSGHLQARLNEAMNGNEPEAVGILAALAIARGKAFNAEADSVSDPTRLDSLERALDEFDSNPLNLIWNAQAAGYSPKFMAQILEHFVRERELSRDELDQISSNMEFYFKPLSRGERHVLARKIGEDPNRVERIGKLSPSSMLVDILTPLLRSGAKDAQRQCKSTVENLPVDSWISYLSGNGDWVFDLLEKCPDDFKLTINSNAVEAAVQLIDERSAALSISERARLRRMASRFNIHAERRLIDAIIAQGQRHTRNALALAKALKHEMAAAISGHLTSDGFVTLVGGFSLISNGRDWLEDHLLDLQKAIDRFDQSSKKALVEWVNATKKQKPKVRANWIEMMSNRLDFGH